jgi:hypothetical protein
MDVIQKEFPAKLGMKDAITLTDFRDALLEILGDNLQSIVLYGNATIHDYHPESFDKNVLIVVREKSTRVLREIMKPIQRINKWGFETLIMTKENLSSSTDVFPIRYHSMKESHVLLWGDDLLESLDIHPDHLRLNCEQELRLLLLDLEMYFLDMKGKELKPKLSKVITDFIEILRVAVYLKTNNLPVWNDAILSVRESFDIDSEILEEVMKLRHDEIKLDKYQLEDLYDRFLAFVNMMVRKVDQL